MKGIPINLIGIPLTIDSLRKNGMLGAVEELADGGSVADAIDHVETSDFMTAPIGAVITESIKWKLYKSMKNGTLFKVGGLKFKF